MHMKRIRVYAALVLTAVVLVLAGCGGAEEVTREEAETQRAAQRSGILERTVSRPGPPVYRVGQVGGEYTSTLTNDPRTFNDLTARDADSRTIVDVLSDYLADYDPYDREFKPNLASFEIEADQERDTLRVIFTLREDIYWTTPDSDPSTWVQVTAEDIVFWYNEIDGDPDLQLPGYPGQFVEMPDGSRSRVTVEQLDRFRVAFNYPRIVANPILNANMRIWPRHIYQPAKESGGSEALLNVHSVDTDPRTIPSIGAYHIVEYTPGVRVVLQRNPNYWKTDDEGTSLPYLERVIYRIVPDDNTAYLLFREGTKDGHSVRPDQLEEVLSVQNPDFTVYDGGETLGSAFFVFNQNPSNLDPVKLSWFTQREFRQAMSSVLNRPRIAQQVYRGLASPATHFFARPNPFFNEDIRLEFTYDPERAVELLATIGMERREDGLMYDSDGNHIEFTINMGAENPIGIDVSNIFADELSEIGVTANVRPIDFQNLVERLTTTYDWEVATVALGANFWPEGGSNVWQSSGNFHLWYPFQSSPATEWEARIDHLYNEGRFTIDTERRWEIYNEFQTILLTELPLFYIVHPLAFFAIRDRWQNVFYDTLGGTDSLYFFLEQ